jgi:hypothetical protein
MQPPSINSSVAALRFFFTVTLDRPDLSRRLTLVPQPRRIPAVLSVEEVTQLLRAAGRPRSSTAFRSQRSSEKHPSPQPLPRQIPIDDQALTALPRVPPGGLSDAGPQHARIGHDGPASETLHLSGPSAGTRAYAARGAGSANPELQARLRRRRRISPRPARAVPNRVTEAGSGTALTGPCTVPVRVPSSLVSML